MKFLFGLHAYPGFIRQLYRDNPTLAHQSYAAQLEAYIDSLFAVSDYYPYALRSLGHEADQIVLNNYIASKAWLAEREAKTCAAEPFDHQPSYALGWQTLLANGMINRLQLIRGKLARTPLRHAKRALRPLLRRIDDRTSAPMRHFRKIIETERPDVLVIQSIYAFSNEELADIKKHVGLIVGEHAASKLPDGIDWRLYDLIVSSFQPTLDALAPKGARTALVPLGFDPRTPQRIGPRPRDLTASFLGSLFKVHASRVDWLERIATQFPDLRIHAQIDVKLKHASPLRGRIEPPLWGRDMLAVLAASRLTLNHHGDVLPYANNMRLYEATGMGTLLLTDRKPNLGELFEEDAEIIAYGDAEECIDKMRFYLDPRRENLARKIAEAGQKRTLNQHTYQNRMAQLVDIVRKL